MDQLLAVLDTVELLDVNNASPYILRTTKFDFDPHLFVSDYSTVDWDAVPASVYQYASGLEVY